MRWLVPLAALTGDLVRRLLREGIVVRSLVFPVVLALGAVLSTVLVVLWIQPPQAAALTPSVATPELTAQLDADGFVVLVTDDPQAEVDAGLAAIGTDGATLWIGGGGHPPLQLEEAIRARIGTRWRPHQPVAQRAAQIRESDAPRGLAVFIGALFALYGVVFGAGGIARDRDEGTLDAELSSAVPHLVHGTARWLAGTLVLSGFFAVSIALLDAVLGVPHALQLIVEGSAACGAANALGILVIGQASLTRGFAGPMSVGLVIVFGLLGYGLGHSELAGNLPVASMVVRDGPVLVPTLLSLALGALSAVVFARRTAVG